MRFKTLLLGSVATFAFAGGNAVAAGGPGGGDQVAAGPRVGGAGWPRYGGGRPSSAPIVRDANGNIVHLHESIPE